MGTVVLSILKSPYTVAIVSVLLTTIIGRIVERHKKKKSLQQKKNAIIQLSREVIGDAVKQKKLVEEFAEKINNDKYFEVQLLDRCVILANKCCEIDMLTYTDVFVTNLKGEISENTKNMTDLIHCLQSIHKIDKYLDNLFDLYKEEVQRLAHEFGNWKNNLASYRWQNQCLESENFKDNCTIKKYSGWNGYYLQQEKTLDNFFNYVLKNMKDHFSGFNSTENTREVEEYVSNLWIVFAQIKECKAKYINLFTTEAQKLDDVCSQLNSLLNILDKKKLVCGIRIK